MSDLDKDKTVTNIDLQQASINEQLINKGRTYIKTAVVKSRQLTETTELTTVLSDGMVETVNTGAA